MTLRVFIDGAEGTTGLEIRDRLADRAEFDLLVLDDAARKDAGARKQALDAADIAILCLPDDAARAAAAGADENTRIIDASSAHRTDSGWIYGFPELVGANAIANAARVSNPGCYPTGFLALVVPLLRAKLLDAGYPFAVNAVSGYSGGGKALIARFADQPDLAFRTYGLTLDHKHLGEMQHYAGLTRPPIFAPSVVAAFRGMVVDVPVALGEGIQADELHTKLGEFYADSPVVSVRDETPGELLLHDGAPAWDGLELIVAGSADGTQARLIARLDNLGKGASGAAVQSLNLMAGLPATTGLRLPDKAAQ